MKKENVNVFDNVVFNEQGMPQIMESIKVCKLSRCKTKSLNTA